MAIYAISDLHLSFGTNKPMDIFGVNWENHTKKISKDWEKKVNENDLVLLPGDFSWAMYLKDTYKDFEYLNSLPGKKILLKGNHDYWWTTLKSMKRYLGKNNFKDIEFLQNNSYIYRDKIIVGTRGWGDQETKEDEKVIKRENIRLELSIKDGIQKYGEDKKIIVCTHFPPFNNERFMNILKSYKVKTCIFGHVHGEIQKDIFQGKRDGINFKLVSSDYTEFKLIKLL